MTRGIYTILLLIASNTFMTIAWYGHLRYREINFLKNTGVAGAVLVSWCIALFEYMLMVPANRFGSSVNGGPFSIWQLKIIQEVISISVFVVFALVFFKTDNLQPNHLIGFLFMIASIYFFFRK